MVAKASKKSDDKDRKPAQDNIPETSSGNEVDPVAGEAPEEPSVEELEQQVKDFQDRYLRAKAELENAKKRSQREASEIRENTKISTIQEFFSVLDHFQMAMDHVDQTPDVETLKQGMNMILGEFRRTFEALGVETLNATGREFNPNEHDAVAQEPSDSVPKDHVLRQWKCGYRMGGRLLRPASVIVSSGPETPGEETA